MPQSSARHQHNMLFIRLSAAMNGVNCLAVYLLSYQGSWEGALNVVQPHVVTGLQRVVTVQPLQLTFAF